MSGYKVSVIVPIYGVEKFIRKCVDSLMRQTLREVEFVFVDDASTDHSVDILNEVLSEYPQRRGDVTVLRHPLNLGLPSARNTGMNVVKGEYVYHCDADDYLEPNMLETLYRAAGDINADIAYCDFWLTFESNERLMRNPAFSSAFEMLVKGFLSGRMKFNVWNKLVKRRLYKENGIIFPDGHPMGEDMTMICIASYAKEVACVPLPLYHYVKTNGGAYSNNLSEKNINDIVFNVERVSSFLRERFGDSLEKELSFFKLSNKLPFIISDEPEQFKRWQELWPEANAFIMQNTNQPLRTRLVQLAADQGWFWAVKMYYTLVYRFVYGAVYK